jgi:hypothetical protein
LYKFLPEDAKSKFIEQHFGHSVMLFGSEIGKPVPEGVLMKNFFDEYNKIKHLNDINIGWELLNKHFYAD